MIIEILKGETVFKSFECPESEGADLLKRARLRSDVLNQTGEGYTARIQPEEVEEAAAEVVK